MDNPRLILRYGNGVNFAAGFGLGAEQVAKNQGRDQARLAIAPG